jgi:hypothetical protein
MACKEAKVIFHQVSINLENLAYAGPVALWHAHHQFPVWELHKVGNNKIKMVTMPQRDFY